MTWVLLLAGIPFATWAWLRSRSRTDFELEGMFDYE